MSENDNKDHEVFIDADAGFSNEQNSYESIILKQIQECVKILSREMTGGQVMHKAGPTGVEKYVEDVRELVINHIDTLRMLMCFHIEGKNKEQLETILKEITDYKQTIGEHTKIVPGAGVIKIKNIKGLSPSDPHWKDFINFKALKYREIFEILVSCYNKHKSEIRKLEEE